METILEKCPDKIIYLKDKSNQNLPYHSKDIVETVCPICLSTKKMRIYGLYKVKKYECSNCMSIGFKMPHLVKYLKNKKDAELPCFTNKKITVVCPDCNFEKQMSAYSLCTAGINCKNCTSIENVRPDLIKYLKNEEDKKITFGSAKKIVTLCPICGFEKVVTVNRLSRNGMACENCNTLENKRPDLLCYLKNENDKNIMHMSNLKIDCKCPHCGVDKKISPGRLSYYGFSCQNCSDGVSLPEKFMKRILDALKIEYIYQYKPEWSNNKRYDFYIPSLNMIIETHGAQHYTKSMFKTDYEYIKNNDDIKYRLSMSNGIEKYIIINCSKSSKEWLMYNIKNSLIQYINCEGVDYNSIWEECQRSLAIISKEMFLSGSTVKEISHELSIHETTIYKYLKSFNIELRFKDGKPNPDYKSIKKLD